MKKWFPAFLFLSLSGCNDALAGWHNVMFYAFNDYSGYDSGNMTIFDRGQFTIPWKTGAASAIYSSCQTPEFVSGVYFQEYIAWVLVPRSTQTTDRYTVFFLMSTVNMAGIRKIQVIMGIIISSTDMNGILGQAMGGGCVLR
ncbi:TPA: PapG carbohydrate binding domain-containing protein [Escherichia coli]|uniref:PapG carbohydrate binding domain-containing protein n=1 Tax=Escherichia coli TaxID=562 RepID=UPI00125B1554|nr:PapG carbohydrate binding domain-containing protein [Escherichia coli]EHQ6150673.1 carbohydrate-binding protein [Escherichia coli]EKF5548268.1 carbohydrate-binding protein [Escherichia coli]EKJ0884082.1 carbohydrate-binding protein [Escherichia coli]MBN3543383.1 carbohydrate-binding protein [Escherichia coli]MDF0959910.1 PapG carbohydrate binding domain-containing protein [Escherichia coli]